MKSFFFKVRRVRWGVWIFEVEGSFFIRYGVYSLGDYVSERSEFVFR